MSGSAATGGVRATAASASSVEERTVELTGRAVIVTRCVSIAEGVEARRSARGQLPRCDLPPSRAGRRPLGLGDAQDMIVPCATSVSRRRDRYPQLRPRPLAAGNGNGAWGSSTRRRCRCGATLELSTRRCRSSRGASSEDQVVAALRCRRSTRSRARRADGRSVGAGAGLLQRRLRRSPTSVSPVARRAAQRPACRDWRPLHERRGAGSSRAGGGRCTPVRTRDVGR